MVIAGIDFSTFAIDVVLLDEDTDAATWFRADIQGADAFERARDVHRTIEECYGSSMWEDVLAIGIEDPRGYNAGALYRIQGAILACLPRSVLVQPWIPSAWRKTVGLPGNASKGHVCAWAIGHLVDTYATVTLDMARVHTGIGGPRPVRTYPSWIDEWPQDATDAYCIALATRSQLEHSAAA